MRPDYIICVVTSDGTTVLATIPPPIPFSIAYHPELQTWSEYQKHLQTVLELYQELGTIHDEAENTTFIVYKLKTLAEDKNPKHTIGDGWYERR